jgi:predicted N-acetyltransferase YhbS
MSTEAVRIERIKIKDLPAVAAGFIDGAAPGTFIPITKQRAMAALHNPFAAPDDVGLLLAMQGERPVGYFGIMPVMLRHNGQLHKVHWLTTWTVTKDFIGKGLGSRLMEEAIALGVDLAIVGSKPARRVSAKFGFREVAPLDFVQLDFAAVGRYNILSLLLRALRKLASIVGLRISIEKVDAAFSNLFENLLGWIVRPWLYLFAARRTNAELRDLKISPVDRVPDMPTPQQGSGFYRDASVVNWMLAHPWVLPVGGSASEKLDYEFTDARRGFKILAWQVSGKHSGYIVFQSSLIRGRRLLKVLDFSFEHSPAASLLLALALKAARQEQAHSIEGPAELAEPLRASLLGRLLVQHRQRVCQVHAYSETSPMAQAWQQIRQTYVDGDTAFT